MLTPFADRAQAGKLLALRVQALRLPPPIVVVALPRGGVVVAAPVARALAAPLDLLLVRRIGQPWQRQVALAAVAEGDPPEIVIDEAAQRRGHVAPNYMKDQTAVALREIERLRQAYLGRRAPLQLAGCTVVLVDDGVATGTTVRAALQVLRRRGAEQVVLAVPVGEREAIEALRSQTDRIVCLAQPARFKAINLHYRDFHPLEDDEVLMAMGAARVPGAARAAVATAGS